MRFELHFRRISQMHYFDAPYQSALYKVFFKNVIYSLWQSFNLVYFPRLSFFLDTPDKFRPIEP